MNQRPELAQSVVRTLRAKRSAIDRTTTVTVAMLAVDVLLWVLLYTGVVPMPGMMWLMEQGIPMAAPGAMELGVFHVGTVGAVLGYLAMWGVMMWAMMYPAMTRYLREYTAQHRGSVTAVAGVAAVFLLGYQLVWALSGVVPLAFDLVLPGGIYGITRANPPLVIGAVLVFTGLYQLTAFKRVRLRACCDAVPPHETGLVRGLRDGLRHGVACVLTCFAPFFLVMPFFGEMNFFWMVALTGVVTLERLPTWGEEITVGTGIVALAAGVAVLVLQPALPVAFVA